MKRLEEIFCDWAVSDRVDTGGSDDSYCATRDVFLDRLGKMPDALLEKKVSEDTVYLLSAIVGEIGSNSFDHNLGGWRDAPGILFGYEARGNELVIALADRGQGVRATLERVKPEISSDEESLRVAFTEKISGRAPEKRGNGLKFVRSSIAENTNMHLDFYSGTAHAASNKEFSVQESVRVVPGCLAIIHVDM